MFRRIFFVFIFLVFFQLATFSQALHSSVNKALNSFDFDRDSVVSISVKDKLTGKTLYEKNAYKFLNPASVIKLFTMAASYDILGEDFEFKTAFYSDYKGNLYLKLSGDPMLSTSDLNELCKKLKNAYSGKIHKIYIDDSIIDFVPYPDGWMSDDIWPNFPKLSPYMVDRNTVSVDFYLNPDKKDVKILQKNPYKFSFVNKLNISDTTNINFRIDPEYNTVDVLGDISQTVTGFQIPVINPKYFFCQKLNSLLNKNNIKFSDKFLFARTPDGLKLVAEVKRPLDLVVAHALYTSDNLSTEMIFKVAGEKYARNASLIKTNYQSFGTTKNGVNMFLEYCNKIGLDSKKIKLQDGSGVSRYSVTNADWIAEGLSKMNFPYEKFLPTSGKGTLLKRMREFEGKVFFKTGTLYGISSLAGIIKGCNKEYAYASIIMSYTRNKSQIKAVEDEIVYQILRQEEEENDQ